MAIRTGSLSRSLLDLPPDTRSVLLEDYRTARRRDHCSRVDFADGWLAALRRMQHDQETRDKLLKPVE